MLHQFERQVELFFNSNLGNLTSAVIIILATYIFNKITRYFLNRRMVRRSLVERVDATGYIFMKHAITGVIYTIGISFGIMKIPALKELSVSLFASAGILALIAGFASQHAFANIVSGVFLTLWQPFRINDRIFIATIGEGIVEDISLRHTIIRTLENKRIIIPNSKMANEVIVNFNLKDEKIVNVHYFQISYESSVKRAFEIIREIAENHPLFVDHRSEQEKKQGTEKVAIHVTELGDNGVTLRAQIGAENPEKGYDLKWDINRLVLEAFKDNQIDIPYPQTTLTFKGPGPKEPT